MMSPNSTPTIPRGNHALGLRSVQCVPAQWVISTSRPARRIEVPPHPLPPPQTESLRRRLQDCSLTDTKQKNVKKNQHAFKHVGRQAKATLRRALTSFNGIVWTHAYTRLHTCPHTCLHTDSHTCQQCVRAKANANGCINCCPSCEPHAWACGTRYATG